MNIQDKIVKQHEVDKILNRGLVFSIVWIFGVGSIICLILTTKAKRKIQKFNLEGMDTVWPCYCIAIWGLTISASFIFRFIIE